MTRQLSSLVEKWDRTFRETFVLSESISAKDHFNAFKALEKTLSMVIIYGRTIIADRAYAPNLQELGGWAFKDRPRFSTELRGRQGTVISTSWRPRTKSFRIFIVTDPGVQIRNEEIGFNRFSGMMEIGGEERNLFAIGFHYQSELGELGAFWARGDATERRGFPLLRTASDARKFGVDPYPMLRNWEVFQRVTSLPEGTSLKIEPGPPEVTRTADAIRGYLVRYSKRANFSLVKNQDGWAIEDTRGYSSFILQLDLGSDELEGESLRFVARPGKGGAYLDRSSVLITTDRGDYEFPVRSISWFLHGDDRPRVFFEPVGGGKTWRMVD